MKRALIAAAFIVCAAPAFAQQTGGLPALRTQVDALQSMVNALGTQVAGLPALSAQVTALQATVDALTSSFSQPHQTSDLKGDFATTGSAVCVQSLANGALPPAGFNADFSPKPGPVNTLTFTINGVRTFNGDGTGSLHARVVSNTVNGPSNAGDISGDFTYNVASDGSLTIEHGSQVLSFDTGPLKGQANSIADIPAFIGHISKDGQTITTANSSLAVETVTRVDTGLVSQVRVCHRSRVSVRIN